MRRWKLSCRNENKISLQKKKKKLLNRVTMSPSGQLLLNWYSVPDWSVPHPAIFGMCRFFDKHSEENKHCAAGESGVVLALLSGVQGQNPGNFGYFAFWIAQNITLSSATRKIDKSLTPEINTYEHLQVWVWDSKPIYQLQNSSGYDTAHIMMKNVEIRGKSNNLALH